MKYVLQGRLKELKSGQDYDPGAMRVETMTLEEYQKSDCQFPYKNMMLRNMANIHYSKAELVGKCVIGTLVIPHKEDLIQKKNKFGYYMDQNELYFIGDTELPNTILMEMIRQQYGQDCTMADLLADFLTALIQKDALFLQHIEEKLSLIEEGMADDHIPKNFYKIVLHYRKQLLILHTSYEQLMNVGDEIESDTNHILSEREEQRFNAFSNRAERLHNHSEMLREYVLQIREMFQSQIDLNQNHTMNILTLVTSLFLPLSILVGWYGMNFKNMPELSWKYGYVGVIILSIIIIIAEIIFFKKKGLF